MKLDVHVSSLLHASCSTVERKLLLLLEKDNMFFNSKQKVMQTMAEAVITLSRMLIVLRSSNALPRFDKNNSISASHQNQLSLQRDILSFYRSTKHKHTFIPRLKISSIPIRQKTFFASDKNREIMGKFRIYAAHDNKLIIFSPFFLLSANFLSQGKIDNLKFWIRSPNPRGQKLATKLVSQHLFSLLNSPEKNIDTIGMVFSKISFVSHYFNEIIRFHNLAKNTGCFYLQREGLNMRVMLPKAYSPYSVFLLTLQNDKIILMSKSPLYRPPKEHFVFSFLSTEIASLLFQVSKELFYEIVDPYSDLTTLVFKVRDAVAFTKLIDLYSAICFAVSNIIEDKPIFTIDLVYSPNGSSYISFIYGRGIRIPVVLVYVDSATGESYMASHYNNETMTVTVSDIGEKLIHKMKQFGYLAFYYTLMNRLPDSIDEITHSMAIHFSYSKKYWMRGYINPKQMHFPICTVDGALPAQSLSAVALGALPPSEANAFSNISDGALDSKLAVLINEMVDLFLKKGLTVNRQGSHYLGTDFSLGEHIQIKLRADGYWRINMDLPYAPFRVEFYGLSFCHNFPRMIFELTMNVISIAEIGYDVSMVTAIEPGILKYDVLSLLHIEFVIDGFGIDLQLINVTEIGQNLFFVGTQFPALRAKFRRNVTMLTDQLCKPHFGSYVCGSVRPLLVINNAFANDPCWSYSLLQSKNSIYLIYNSKYSMNVHLKPSSILCFLIPINPNTVNSVINLAFFWVPGANDMPVKNVIQWEIRVVMIEILKNAVEKVAAFMRFLKAHRIKKLGYNKQHFGIEIEEPELRFIFGHDMIQIVSARYPELIQLSKPLRCASINGFLNFVSIFLQCFDLTRLLRRLFIIMSKMNKIIEACLWEDFFNSLQFDNESQKIEIIILESKCDLTENQFVQVTKSLCALANIFTSLEEDDEFNAFGMNKFVIM